MRNNSYPLVPVTPSLGVIEKFGGAISKIIDSFFNGINSVVKTVRGDEYKIVTRQQEIASEKIEAEYKTACNRSTLEYQKFELLQMKEAALAYLKSQTDIRLREIEGNIELARIHSEEKMVLAQNYQNIICFSMQTLSVMAENHAPEYVLRGLLGNISSLNESFQSITHPQHHNYLPVGTMPNPAINTYHPVPEIKTEVEVPTSSLSRPTMPSRPAPRRPMITTTASQSQNQYGLLTQSRGYPPTVSSGQTSSYIPLTNSRT